MTARTTWCAKHWDGWCARADGGMSQYEDNIPTVCGYFIIFTGGIERRAPTCPECIAVLRQPRPKRRKP